MRFIFLLCLIAIAFSAECSEDYLNIGYHNVKVSFIPNFVNEYADKTLKMTLTTNPFVSADFIDGKGRVTKTYTYEQIKNNEAKATYCVNTANPDPGNFNYKITVTNSDFTEFCYKVEDLTGDLTYIHNCPETRTNHINYFTFDSFKPAKVYFNYNNKYIDYYLNTPMRDTLKVVFDSKLESETNYVIDTVSTSLTGVIDNGFNLDTLSFGSIELDSGIESGSVEVINSITIEDVTSSETATFNIQRFKCDEPNEFPVIFTRVLSKTSKYEGYNITNASGEVVFGDSQTSDKTIISEVAKCLPQGQYSLIMFTQETVDGDKVGISWVSDSFLTISTLSKGDAQNTVTYTGFIVGDFAFNAYLNDDMTTYATVNTIPFPVGPIICPEHQKIAIFTKYATRNGGREGFELRSSTNSEEGAQSVTLYSYFGFANLVSYTTDPYFKAFICVESNTQYAFVLQVRAVYNPNDVTYLSCQAGFSKEHSFASINYPDLNGNIINGTYPSFMMAEITSASLYNGGLAPPALQVYGGLSWALDDEVSGTGPNVNVREGSFTIRIPDLVTFHIEENGVPITEENPLSLKYYNEPADLAVVCTENCDNVLFWLSCYNSQIDAIFEINGYECIQMGLRMDHDNNKIEGYYSPQDKLAHTFYVRVDGKVSQGSAGRNDDIFNDYRIFSVSVRADPRIEDCPHFVTKQDEQFTIPSTQPFSEDVQLTCTHGEFTISEGFNYHIDPSDSKNLLVTFEISSESPFDCLINGVSPITVYVQPHCKDHEHPLFLSVAADAIEYKEECYDDDKYSIESVCVYDPVLMKASVMERRSLCHKSDRVPIGHGFVTGIYVITGEAREYNYPSFPYWFKRLVEHDFKEALTAPVKNCYITNIKNEYTHEGDRESKLTVVCDTTYENAIDVERRLADPGYLEKLNQLLDKSIPSFWAPEYGNHDLVLSLTYSDLNPNFCPGITDEEDTFYTYFLDNDQTELRNAGTLTWDSAVIWYYSFHEIGGSVAPEYDDPNQEFFGAFTRYCRPKYYKAMFLSTNTFSASQTVKSNTPSYFFTAKLDYLDPRSVNSEARYTFARALNRYVLHGDSNVDNSVHIFDINVHMVKGLTPTFTNSPYYRDSVFYIEVQLATRDEIPLLQDNIRSVLDSNRMLKTDVNTALMTFMQDHLGELYSPASVFVMIDLKEAPSRTLRY